MTPRSFLQYLRPSPAHARSLEWKISEGPEGKGEVGQNEHEGQGSSLADWSQRSSARPVMGALGQVPPFPMSGRTKAQHLRPGRDGQWMCGDELPKWQLSDGDVSCSHHGPKETGGSPRGDPGLVLPKPLPLAEAASPARPLAWPVPCSAPSFLGPAPFRASDSNRPSQGAQTILMPVKGPLSEPQMGH